MLFYTRSNLFIVAKENRIFPVTVFIDEMSAFFDIIRCAGRNLLSYAVPHINFIAGYDIFFGIGGNFDDTRPDRMTACFHRFDTVRNLGFVRKPLNAGYAVNIFFSSFIFVLLNMDTTALFRNRHLPKSVCLTFL